MSSEAGASVKAVLLAAGVGKRLGAAHDGPKVLLEFGEKTLLQRHLDALAACGVRDLAITIGHEGAAIRRAAAQSDAPVSVSFVENPAYREGSLVSLFAQRERLESGTPILLLDGDVLYDSRMIERLLAAPYENALLVDRQIEPGDEPVKICFRGDRIVDFRKVPTHSHDWFGESVGFFRFSPAMAAALATQCGDYVARGETKVEYEEAIRDLILAQPERFGAADISDLPWTEIDFEADVARARNEVLPQLVRS